MLGYLPQDLLGAPVLLFLHPEDRPLMLAIHKKSEFLSSCAPFRLSPGLPNSCPCSCVFQCLGLLDFGGGGLQGAPPPYLALPPTDPHLISHSLQSCSWLASPLTTPLSASAPGMGSTSPWTPAGLASCTPGAARWPLCWAATKYARKWVVPWRAGQCGGGRAQLILPTPQGAPE